jgi:hypothetical protein
MAIVSRRVWRKRVLAKLIKVCDAYARGNSQIFRLRIVGLVTMCYGYLSCCGSIPTIEMARDMAARLIVRGYAEAVRDCIALGM